MKTYIFEIVEVVPDPNVLPERWYRLRLRCRDEAKGPVTAICGLSGYVVSAVGQKVIYFISYDQLPSAYMPAAFCTCL